VWLQVTHALAVAAKKGCVSVTVPSISGGIFTHGKSTRYVHSLSMSFCMINHRDDISIHSGA
jgi:hypothetical protein